VSDRDRQTAELIAELRRSEERFRTICENAPVMIDQFSPEGRCLLWNHECEKQLGYTQEEIERADDPLALFYPDPAQRSRVVEAIQRADGTFREYRVRAKDGTDRTQLWADFRLPDGAQISVGHDVTEQRKVEEQLRQSQKMEALGQLTGGMAHDFNNLLTVVLANAEMLRELEPGSAEAKWSLDEIISSASRGATLIRKLLAVGRSSPLDVQPLDVASLIQELAPTVKRLLPDSIRVRVQTEPSLPRVAADQGAVEQILINLITNARDAMEGTGSLTVTVEGRWINRAQANVLQCGPGDHVAIVVSDDGSGMDEETRLRVFEPFFSTKEEGGTGLGMTMVYGLMRQQGGAALVESEPSVGTQVHLIFPVASSKPNHPCPEPPAKRILVVEDEPSIRRIARVVLERAGYAVEEAPDGTRALERLRGPDAHFDLVLCDVVLPGLGGSELHDEVQRAGHAPPFLFVTGYADDQLLAKLGNDGAVKILRKPYRMDQLLEAVATAIGDGDGNGGEMASGA